MKKFDSLFVFFFILYKFRLCKFFLLHKLKNSQLNYLFFIVEMRKRKLEKDRMLGRFCACDFKVNRYKDRLGRRYIFTFPDRRLSVQYRWTCFIHYYKSEFIVAWLIVTNRCNVIEEFNCHDFIKYRMNLFTSCPSFIEAIFAYEIRTGMKNMCALTLDEIYSTAKNKAMQKLKLFLAKCTAPAL